MPDTDATTLTERLFALVAASPDGMTARELAGALPLTHPTACCLLSRLFWAGRVDRSKVGRSYRYRPRPARH